MIEKIIEILRNPVDYSFAERVAAADWLEGQEPVGTYKGFDIGYEVDLISLERDIPDGAKIYAAPVPPRDLVALCEYVAMETWERSGEGYNHEFGCDTVLPDRLDIDAIIAKHTKGGA